MASGDVAVETIRTLDGFAALRTEWDRLLTETGNTMPFHEHDWLSLWWAHFRNDRETVSDSLRLKVVRTRGGELVGIAPLMLTERLAMGMVRTRTLQFLGSDPRLTELKGPIVSPRYEEAVARALLADLREDGPWDWTRWTGLKKGSRFLEVLHEECAIAWSAEDFDYVLAPLPPTWEAFRSSLKRNIRESLRHGYNSLKRDGHSFALEVAEEPDDLGPALETFTTLHSLRAREPGAVLHLDRFRGARVRGFMQALTARLAPRRAMVVFTLCVDGTPVASRLGFRVGDSLYLYYSGYDTAWGKYGVMTTTVAEAIKWAIGRGLKSVNLSFGTDVSKTRWGPQQIAYVEAMQVHPRLRSRALYASSAVAYRVRKDPRCQNLARRAPRVKAVVGQMLARRSWD